MSYSPYFAANFGTLQTTRLKFEEERHLIKESQLGNREALDDLIMHNLRFVISVARQYMGHGLNLVELVSEGVIGMHKAAMRFDLKQSVKFISYAVWWIKLGIQTALYDQASVVQLPIHKQQLLKKFRRQLEKCEGDLNKVFECDELKGRERDIANMAEAMTVTSLDAPITSSNSKDAGRTTLLDMLEAPSDDDTSFETGSLKRSLEQALDSLEQREAVIIRLYYGFNYSKCFTLEEISSQLHITRERVRQVRETALRKLSRNKKSKDQLLLYFDQFNTGSQSAPFHRAVA